MRIDLATQPRARLALLCVLYLAQGIPWGFVVITLAAWLAEQGLGTSEIGAMLALSTLPWSFKWTMGPVVDAVALPGGRRRPWIVLAQGMMTVTVLAMALLPDLTRDLALLGACVLVHNCFAALQDVAVDALAVDLLDEGERGRANGLMYGSKYLGGALGGAGMATAVAAWGIRPAMWLQVAVLAGITALPLLAREPTVGAAAGAPAAPRPRAAAVVVALAGAFAHRSALAAAALAGSAYLAVGVLSTVAAVFFTQHLGWSAEAYAGVSGGWGLALGLTGSVVGGFVADRIGPRTLIAAASVALGVLWIAFAAAEPLWSSEALVTALLLAESLLVALISVGMFALFMAVSWPVVAATQFTAFMSLLNLSTTLGHRLAGPLDAVLDYPGLYLCAGVGQIAVVALLGLIDPVASRRLAGEAVATSARQAADDA